MNPDEPVELGDKKGQLSTALFEYDVLQPFIVP